MKGTLSYMENLIINKTKCTPLINFTFSSNTLEIKGESYPENTSEFYEPVFEWLDKYLKKEINEKTIVNIEIIYFNSSSSKVLMDFFDIFEQAAEEGKNIEVNWRYDKENDMALEYGEEFKEDLESLKFNLVEI